MPEQVPAAAERRLWIHLARGDLDDGAPVAVLRERFNPFVARVGGTQHNDLEADTRGGTVGVEHRFAQLGDAMVGFSTEPRLVAWPMGDGATEEEHRA